MIEFDDDHIYWNTATRIVLFEKWRPRIIRSLGYQLFVSPGVYTIEHDTTIVYNAPVYSEETDFTVVTTNAYARNLLIAGVTATGPNQIEFI